MRIHFRRRHEMDTEKNHYKKQLKEADKKTVALVNEGDEDVDEEEEEELKIYDGEYILNQKEHGRPHWTDSALFRVVFSSMLVACIMACVQYDVSIATVAVACAVLFSFAVLGVRFTASPVDNAESHAEFKYDVTRFLVDYGFVIANLRDYVDALWDRIIWMFQKVFGRLDATDGNVATLQDGFAELKAENESLNKQVGELEKLVLQMMSDAPDQDDGGQLKIDVKSGKASNKEGVSHGNTNQNDKSIRVRNMQQRGKAKKTG